MKKNLRIVSAAAAALLAVAPVAASAVSTVSADAVQSATDIGPVNLPTSNAAVNVKPNVSLNTAVPSASIKASISVSFTATVDGTTATANLDPKSTEVSLYKGTVSDKNKVTNLQDVKSDDAGAEYKVGMNNVSLNFGSQNANKKVTLTFPDNGSHFGYNGKDGRSQEVQLDKNGVVTLSYVIFPVTAKNFANPAVVNWLNSTTNAVVNSGNVELYAGSDAGKMNVDQVIAAVRGKYYATNFGTLTNKEASDIKYTNNLVEALKAMNVSVTDGWFVAPKSFTFNMTATANNNDASKTLAVTVNVPNGKDMTPAAVPSTGNVTIMHAAYTYELKDGKLTRVSSADTLHAYSEVPVYGTTTVNGKKYYRVSGTHNWYINAGNVDGTSRSLKHNSYVYNNKGKRVKSEGTWKKGSKHTTYGAAMDIKGQRMYRVNKNRYVKVVNFD